jgi:hypothetical protein
MVSRSSSINYASEIFYPTLHTSRCPCPSHNNDVRMIAKLALAIPLGGPESLSRHHVVRGQASLEPIQQSLYKATPKSHRG